ncbi:MAG: serine/threonine protein kinase [Ignavibacteria bacterium]|nr:serine/threonine protein kinase [Ignavibacteria bacterium]
MIGRIIGNYKITEFIAEGGMGTVYKGIHLHIDKVVAIKELHHSLTNYAEFRQRFLNEAQILAKLSHPNVISIIDFIADGNSFYIITEYQEGKTLDNLISNGHFYSVEKCKVLFSQILAGIDFAHKNGVIHRDIKPSNILISNNNLIKILDFGIAKISDTGRSLTRTGTKMGSLLYMSPEQILGKEVDFRTDIYSLGILFF